MRVQNILQRLWGQNAYVEQGKIVDAIGCFVISQFSKRQDFSLFATGVGFALLGSAIKKRGVASEQLQTALYITAVFLTVMGGCTVGSEK